MNSLTDDYTNHLATEHLRVFRQAAKLLASSLEFEQTLANTISACLPAVGDFGFFDVVMDDGVHRTARACMDPEVEAILQPTQWLRQERTDMNLCALATGRPALASVSASRSSKPPVASSTTRVGLNETRCGVSSIKP